MCSLGRVVRIYSFNTNTLEDVPKGIITLRLIRYLGGVSGEASTHTSTMHSRDGNSSLQARNQSRNRRRREHRRSICCHSLLPELPPRKLRIRRRREQQQRKRRRSSETAMASYILKQEIQVEIEQRVPTLEKAVDSSRNLSQGRAGIGAERFRFGMP